MNSLQERNNFFGGRLLPLNGVRAKEYWPTDEEFSIIQQATIDEPFIMWLIEKYGHERASVINENFDETALYVWLCENFLAYTQNNAIEVTEDLVLKALKDYSEKEFSLSSLNLS